MHIVFTTMQGYILCTCMSLCVVHASLYISTPTGMEGEIATISQENVVLRQQYEVLSSELREMKQTLLIEIEKLKCEHSELELNVKR